MKKLEKVMDGLEAVVLFLAACVVAWSLASIVDILWR
jgi:hypothetical protein